MDAGGGNGILRNIQKARIPWQKLNYAFLSHHHTDHMLGMVWIIRQVAMLILRGQYEKNLKIYCHTELVHDISSVITATLDKRIQDLIGKRILLIPLQDRQKETIIGYNFTFFDIHSTKAKQFGFTAKLKQGQKLTFLGDEPYNPICQDFVKNSDWLLSEAFCLYRDRNLFKPYEKHHSTVKEACELASQLNVKNLVLWHTEDQNITQRKELYTAEGQLYYKGNLYVPDDLDEIKL